MVLIGAAPVEPPGVTIDPGDVEVQPEFGKLLLHRGVDLFPQLPHGAGHQGQVLLLAGLKPAALIVEADAPQKVHRLLGKSLKHVYPSYLLRL